PGAQAARGDAPELSHPVRQGLATDVLSGRHAQAAGARPGGRSAGQLRRLGTGNARRHSAGNQTLAAKMRSPERCFLDKLPISCPLFSRRFSCLVLLTATAVRSRTKKGPAFAPAACTTF